MLLEFCGCGFDPGRFFGDPPKFSHPCQAHKDIQTLIPHASWARLVDKQKRELFEASAKQVVVEDAPKPKLKRNVGDKLSIDDKPV